MVSVARVSEFVTQGLIGLGCLIGMIVFSVIVIIIGKKEE